MDETCFIYNDDIKWVDLQLIVDIGGVEVNNETYKAICYRVSNRRCIGNDLINYKSIRDFIRG